MTWYGFEHVDQTISYQLAVGTVPGSDDVIAFADVGLSNKLLTNLTLEPFTVNNASKCLKKTIVQTDLVTLILANLQRQCFFVLVGPNTVTPLYNDVVGRHLLRPPYKRGALCDPVDLVVVNP